MTTEKIHKIIKKQSSGIFLPHETGTIQSTMTNYGWMYQNWTYAVKLLKFTTKAVFQVDIDLAANQGFIAFLAQSNLALAHTNFTIRHIDFK